MGRSARRHRHPNEEEVEVDHPDEDVGQALGYLVRSDAPDEGRARIVRVTRRGRAAYAKIQDILRDIERDWSAELGPTRFAELKELLFRVWDSPLIR